MQSAVFKAAVVLLLTGAMAVASGCIAPVVVGAAAGYGAYAWTQGDLDGVAYAGVDRTWHATLLAVQQLELTVHEQHKQATQARLLARQADETEVRIRIQRRCAEFTRINVRVGVFGDERRSRAIMDAIRANL